jgi:hypothetical protein
MKMIFNGLDQRFKLLSSRHGRESQEILCFAKHHNLTLYIHTHREQFIIPNIVKLPRDYNMYLKI